MNFNFLRLFTGVFASEFGGYLTNTVILFYVNQVTGGSRLYLGLTLALFVGPLALGTLLGGAIGESYDRRRVMLFCDSLNMLLIASLLFAVDVHVIIAVRAIVVFSAGVYNPSRLAIVQELVEHTGLRSANAMFTTMYAILHSVGPAASALLFKRYGGVHEVFIINVFTYMIGIGMVWSVKYEGAPSVSFHPRQFARGVRDGFLFVWRRPDLSAMLLNFALGGICLGFFHSLLLPFISEIFRGDESTYAQLMAAFGVGGVFGGTNAAMIMRRISKGKILVWMAFLQASALLAWTQISFFPASFILLFFWGMIAMTIIATYINYVQVNVPRQFQARSFSIFDLSISLNVCVGAGMVSLVSNRMTGYALMTFMALAAVTAMVAQGFMSLGVRELYSMET